MALSQSLANFGRGKERLWFPILQERGFKDLELATEQMDKDNAIDAWGIDEKTGRNKYFALRLRDETSYREPALTKYKREFTIRYARPSGVPVEWQKIFQASLNVATPDYFCYGWVDANGRITDYIIINIEMLRHYERHGHLKKYENNRRRNSDPRRSELVFLSLSELMALDKEHGFMDKLFFGYSENHPMLATRPHPTRS